MGSACRVAVAGLGGYAAQHHRAFENLEREGRCRMVATCDPQLKSPHLPTYRTLEELLQRHAGELDLVTLPVPIPFHAAMHRQVVEAGVACYLEKPPTLWWPEYEAMMAVEAQSVRPTQVGFNFIGDPFRKDIKARIDANEFGRLQRATFLGVWPRDSEYYDRARWAGKLTLDGQPVLDNPLGNAMAHHVQNLLFMCVGQEFEEVRAFLLRAHPIESFDTAFVLASLSNGIELRLAATHADDGQSDAVETFTFERGKITFTHWNRAEIESNGTVETIVSAVPDQFSMLQANLSAFIEGVATTPLAACGPFVSLIDLAYLSTGTICDLPQGRIERREGKVRVDGLVMELAQFAQDGVWPGETPRLAVPRELATLGGLH